MNCRYIYVLKPLVIGTTAVVSSYLYLMKNLKYAARLSVVKLDFDALLI